MPFPTVKKYWKSVNIWQRYREFKGGIFFETQCFNVIAYPIHHARWFLRVTTTHGVYISALGLALNRLLTTKVYGEVRLRRGMYCLSAI